jgi:DHA2 family multidrug resistance protein
MLSCYLISTMYTDASTPESRRAASKVDGIGVALLAVGLGSLQYVLEEGERYDWFGDVWITRITIMAVVGIAAMVIWELSPSNKSPVVNLRIYGNRGLWSAVLISFMIGVGMYGVNYAFSIFVQNVLGFTPMKTGQAMLPLGTGALISLMIVGVVSNLVDSRILTAIGLLACMTGSWMLGFSSQFTGLDDIWLPLGLVGFGAGGAMMPVMVAAFASLKPSETADGSGQLGLGRQLGGSFGIAIINTYIVRMNDFHRATLLQHLSTTNQTFMQTFRGLTGMMMMHGYHGAAAQQASLGLISQMVALQAMIKANNSAFQLVAMMFACSLLLVFLLKSPKR